MKKNLSKKLAMVVFLATVGIVGQSNISSPIHAAETSNIIVNTENKNIGNKDGTYEIDIKTLQKDSDAPSMSATYLGKQAKYTKENGKIYCQIPVLAIDWMKNITIEENGKTIQPEIKETEKNKVLGMEHKGATLRFEVSKVNPSLIFHMYVVPMTNNVTFRIVGDGEIKYTPPIVKETNTKPTITVGKDIITTEGSAIDLMEDVVAQDKEDGTITKNVQVNYGKLNVKNPLQGEYEITYTIKDIKGAIATTKRKVIVKRGTKPISEDNLKNDDSNKYINMKNIPKVTKTTYGDSYGRISYELSLEKNDKLQKYVNSVTSVTVNGIKHSDNSRLGSSEYHLSYLFGFEFSESAFTKPINTIVVKAKGFNDMIIKISKEGKLVSQEEALSSKGAEAKAPVINVGDTINSKVGEPIDLLKGVTAQDEKEDNLTKKIRVNPGKLNASNPSKGIYEVTYSVTNKEGKTTNVKRKVEIFSEMLPTNNLKDGVYTIGFKAIRLDKPTDGSMLQGFFDEKVKLTVKNGDATISMLNTMYAYSLYDFRIESNGKFTPTTSKYYGEANKLGEYEKQTFDIPISDLNAEHIGAVLVGMMGGKKTDIGKMDIYTKVKLVFDKNCYAGWDDFDESRKVFDAENNFNKALIEAKLDKDGDGQVTDEEIAAAKGKIDLSGKKLKDISRLRHFGKNVTHLYLSGNNITKLPKDVFDSMTNLEVLYLSSNNIYELPEGVFDNLTNLKELNLGTNKISSLPENIFNNLLKLESLSLVENNLKKLPNNIFEELTNLNKLYLYNNSLVNIPTSLVNLNNLNSLYLNNNKIKTLPSELGNLNKLTKLYLNSNLIDEIPSTVYSNLKNLQNLDLTDNQLTNIPDNLDKLLPNVNSIDISLNKLNKKPVISEKWLENHELNMYPQKSLSIIKLTAKNGKIEWKQNLSLLDIYCWNNVMNKYNGYKVPTNIHEYKANLKDKDVKEILNSKNREWTINTVIQKKKNSEFLTIKTASPEGKNDELSGSYIDPTMKENDEYRIIKTVLDGAIYKRVIFSDGASTKVITESNRNKVPVKNTTKQKNISILKENSNKPSIPKEYIDSTITLKEIDEKTNDTKNNKIETTTNSNNNINKPSNTKTLKANLTNIKNGLYSIKSDILKANSNEESMSKDYVKDINYEVKNNKKYLIVTLDRSDWMKNVTVTVDGVESTPEVFEKIKGNNNEELSRLKFPINSLDSHIKFNMNVVPMGNKRVSFRIVPKKDSLKLAKDYKTLKEIKAENPTKDAIVKITPINSNKKSNRIINEKLPQTGMPFTTGLLSSLGALIAGLGISLKKKK